MKMSFVKTTENICRTCMSTDGELISLYSDVSVNACLTNKIKNICDVTINERDGLPYMICRKCIFLVESFDCFKKQIQSANKKIRNFGFGKNDQSPIRKLEKQEKNENFDEEDESDDDSVYEIQYISDEVKRKVEDAFRRKQDNRLRIEIHDNSRCLKNYPDVVLIPIEDIISVKEDTRNRDAKRTNSRTLESSRAKREKKQIETGVSDHSLFQYTEDIEQKKFEDNVQNFSQLGQPNSAKENIINIENLDNISSETLQSPNSDCDERLIIETEEPDDYKRKILEPEYVEWKENLDPLRMKDTEKKIFESVYQEEKLISEKINDTEQKNLDPLNLDRDSLKEIFQNKNTDEIDEKTLKSRKLYCDNEKNILESEKFNDGVIKILDPKKPKAIEKKNLESRKTDSRDMRETLKSKKFDNIKKNITLPVNFDFVNENENFSTEKSDNMEKNVLSIEESHCPIEEEFMSMENPLKIVEDSLETEKHENNEKESMEMGKLVNNEEQPMDTEISDNIAENNFHSDFPNSETFVQTSMMEKIADNECSKIEEKSCNHEKKLDDSANFQENGKTPISANKTIVSGENRINDKTTRNDDVIVISSDSSDEERRKNYIETGNKRVGGSRRVRRNFLQSRLTARRNVFPLQDKKITKQQVTKIQTETGLKKIQSRKYFQCTTCKISLYSVSAVLHHHNEMHTPPQEQLSCQMCDVQFPSKIILYEHFEAHVEAHLFRCTYCSCEFVLKRNLRTHMNAHARQKIEEPVSKRLKIGEPSEKLEILSIKENIVDTRNEEIEGRDDKIEAEESMIEQEGER